MFFDSLGGLKPQFQAFSFAGVSFYLKTHPDFLQYHPDFIAGRPKNPRSIGRDRLFTRRNGGFSGIAEERHSLVFLLVVIAFTQQAHPPRCTPLAAV